MYTIKKRTGFQRWPDESAECRGFLGQGNTVYDTIMMDTAYYILCPNTENVNTKNEP